MSNLIKVEGIFSKLEQIDGIQGAVGASVVWSYAMSLVNALATLARMDDRTAPEFARLRPETLAERRSRLEKRVDEIIDIIGWATTYSNPDYLPKGSDLMDRALSSTPDTITTDEEFLKLYTEAMGITREEAEAAVKMNAKQSAERHALLQKQMQLMRKELELRVDAAIASESSITDLSLRDAARILDRIAAKCETYEQQRLQQALNTRRTRRLAQLGAERRILADVMNQADELANQLYQEEENQTEETSVEAAAREAA